MPYMGKLPTRDEIGKVVACSTLILSMRKVKYSVCLHWYIMCKSTTAWSNIYKSG